MNRFVTVALLAFTAASCGSEATAPSPTATSGPTTTPTTRQVATIIGAVLDTGYRVVAGATIEAVDGSGKAGTSTLSGADGRFTLSGTFDGATRIRASKAGYVTATQPWSGWVGFYLAVPRPSVNIAGEYTLTFIADPACADLPTEARTRTFPATMTPAPNGAFSVDVSAPPFIPRFTNFLIGVADDYLGVWLHGGHDPALVEQIAPRTYVALSGVASVAVGSAPMSTVSAPFDGWFEYCELSASDMGYPYSCGTSNSGQPIPGVAIAKVFCESQNHRMILTRR